MKSGVSGVFVGRGVLRNPWILAQARDLLEGRAPRTVSLAERGQFLLEYIHLLLDDPGVKRKGSATWRRARGGRPVPTRGRERWVINKLRALCTWYTKGLEGGSHLRIAMNSAESLDQVREIVSTFFVAEPQASLLRQPPADDDSGLRVAFDMDVTVADMHAVLTREAARLFGPALADSALSVRGPSGGRGGRGSSIGSSQKKKKKKLIANS